jgi:hypothetical protein
MNFCHEYKGLGKTFNKEDSKEVCQVCEGSNRAAALKKK